MALKKSIALCCIIWLLCSVTYFVQKKELAQNYLNFNLLIMNRNETNNLTNKILYKDAMYDFNIFFIETNDSRVFFTFKQLCAIESAAKHNPNAIVNVLTLKAMFSNYSLNILRTYTNIYITLIRPIDVFKGTPLEQWWKDDKLTYISYYYAYAHLSDALRLALLYKHSGVYIDLDTITLRSFQPLLSYSGFVSELQGDNVDTGNSFIIQNKKNDSFLWFVMEKFTKEYKPEFWADNGPFLIKAALKLYCNTTALGKLLLAPNYAPVREDEGIEFKSTQQFCSVNLYPYYIAYPYYSMNTGSLYHHNAKIDISKFLHSYLVHFNGYTNGPMHTQITYNERSAYEFFAAFNCPLAYEQLKKGVYKEF